MTMGNRGLPTRSGALRLIGFFVGAALTILPWIPESPGGTWALLLALFFVGLAPIARELRANNFDLFNLKNIFIAYYLLQLGVFPACALLGMGGSSYFLRASDINNNLYYTAATEAALIGLLFFNMGYYSDLSRTLGRQIPSPPPWHWERATPVATVLAAAGLAAFAVFFSSFGGVHSFLSNLGSWRSLGMIGQGYLILPMTAFMTTSAIVIFMRTITMGKRWSQIFRAALLFGFSLIPTLLLGFRGTLVVGMLQFLAIWHYMHRPISIKKAFVLGATSLAFLTFYGVLRDSLGTDMRARDRVAMEYASSDDLLNSVVFRSQGSEITQKVIRQLQETEDYQYWWRSFRETATILVPHAVWAGKPMPIDLQFGRDFMGDYLYYRDGIVGDATGGISPSAVGFFYWQMGASGVALGMLLLGIFARATYCYLLVDPRDPSRLILYSCMMSSFGLFAESPQDSANGVVIRLIFILGVLSLLTAGSRRISRRPVKFYLPGRSNFRGLEGIPLT